jgi:hypothetical protein
MSRLLTLFLALVVTGACGQPKQAAPPRIPDEPTPEETTAPDPGSGSGDIVPEEGTTLDPVSDEEIKAKEKRRCCQQCVKSMALDKSGDPPDKVQCEQLTAEATKDCLDMFHKSPMNAAQAQACVDAAPPGGGEGTAEKP